MTLPVYPISLADFVREAGTVSATFTPIDAISHSETEGGEVRSVGYGPRNWNGTATLRPYHYGDADRIAAMLEVLTGSAASFFISPQWRRGPQADPHGTSLGASVVQIDTLGPDARQISLSGLPDGYIITRGDFLSFEYGSSPTRYALHRVFSGGTAVGGTVSLTLTMPVRSGASVNATVKLVDPVCKAKIVPKSYASASYESAIADGVSFRWQQVFR